MSTLHVYCGTYRCIEDGRIVHGPLVRYEGGIGKEQEMLRDKTDEYDMRPKAEQGALLVEKMYQAAISGEAIIDMTAALRVAADALLGSAEPNETWKWHEEHNTPELAVVQIIAAYRLSRRARLEAPAKTVEQRVTITLHASSEMFHVCLDGLYRCQFASKSDAEIYRVGLISTLKQEGTRWTS